MSEKYYVAHDADLVGKVFLADQVSIWYHSVLRGDIEPIYVGRKSNIQDNCVVHASDGKPVHIGDNVTIGHGVILHGCTIENRVLVGMGSIILNGAHIGSGSLIGAGTLVLEDQVIPPNSLVVGSPARVIRQLSEDHQVDIDAAVEEYLRIAPLQLKEIPIE